MEAGGEGGVGCRTGTVGSVLDRVLGLVGRVLAEPAVDGRLQHLQFEVLGDLEPDDVTFDLGDDSEDAGGLGAAAPEESCAGSGRSRGDGPGEADSDVGAQGICEVDADSARRN